MANCYEKAVDLLSRRAHFVVELERKLRSRGFDDPELSETLERLLREGLLDDDRCAEELIRVRRRRGAGRMKLASDLAKRGLDQEQVSRHLAALGAHDELRDARSVADRWRSRRPRGDLARPALARHLDRKGFGRSVILTVLDELSSGGRLPDEGPVEE